MVAIENERSVSAADSGHDVSANVMRGVLGDRSPMPSAISATTQLSVCSVAPTCLRIPVPVNSRRQIKPESPDGAAQAALRLSVSFRSLGEWPGQSTAGAGNPVHRPARRSATTSPSSMKLSAATAAAAAMRPGYIRICS